MKKLFEKQDKIKLEIISPPLYNQQFCFYFGLFLRILNKIRHTILGYKTPRMFSATVIEQSITYVLKVTEQWEAAISAYTGISNVFENKNILELGPGPDLGTGLILIAKGAKSYTAFDKFNLLGQSTTLFYETLLNHLKKYPYFEKAKSLVENLKKKKFSNNFFYIVSPTYNFNKLQTKYDLIVSQAVMEHFEKPFEIIKKLYQKMKKNGIIFGEVDLGTHTRILRDIDPINLYRYSDKIWKLLKFKGSPNRNLPFEYKNMLINAGFKDVNIQIIKSYNENYVRKAKKYLSKKFKNSTIDEIKVKSLLLFGIKGD